VGGSLLVSSFHRSADRTCLLWCASSRAANVSCRQFTPFTVCKCSWNW
jgi:hypothetical protein